MKIVFLCNNIKSLNGVERVLTQKMNLLAECADYDIYLITYNQYGDPFSFPLSSKVHHVDLATRYISRCSFRGIYQYIDRYKSERVFRKKLNEVLAKLQPHIVVCTDMHVADLNALLTAKINAVRIVECHCGRAAYFEDLSKIRKFGNRMRQYLLKLRLVNAIKQFDKIVVMTESEKKEWNLPDKVVCIPNMIVHNPLKSSTNNHIHKRVVSVGRYAYQKGYDMLLEAWKLVECFHPDWHLDIHGSHDGGNGEFIHLQKQKESLGLQNVSLHESTMDIYSAYMESDFYVMSSRFESFGLVLVEAMSCGLPIISFDCLYGPISIIKDGITGKLIPKDDVRKLGDAICWMIEHPEDRLRIGQNGKKESENYIPEKIITLWHDFYKSL